MIRPMTSRDLDAVMRLESATPEAPHWKRSTYETLLSRPGAAHLLVAKERGRVVGFLVAQAIADICELESIAVDPASRRAGVGKALFKWLIDSARKLGLSCIQLEVRSGNNSAIAFYEAIGFARDSLRPHYYHDPEEDAVLMTLPLKSDAEM